MKFSRCSLEIMATKVEKETDHATSPFPSSVNSFLGSFGWAQCCPLSFPRAASQFKVIGKKLDHADIVPLQDFWHQTLRDERESMPERESCQLISTGGIREVSWMVGSRNGACGSSRYHLSQVSPSSRRCRASDSDEGILTSQREWQLYNCRETNSATSGMSPRGSRLQSRETQVKMVSYRWLDGSCTYCRNLVTVITTHHQF